MASNIKVDSDGVAKGASETRDIQQHVTSTMATLRSNLDALGRPWRFDDYGSRFADGSHGYVAAKTNLLGGGDDVGTSFGGFADAMDRAVTYWRRTEHNSASQFHS